MSKTEILAELPKLKAADRAEVFARLCELQEADVLHAAEPSAEERKLLDNELAEFERDGNAGTAWREVLKRVRTPGTP